MKTSKTKAAKSSLRKRSPRVNQSDDLKAKYLAFLQNIVRDWTHPLQWEEFINYIIQENISKLPVGGRENVPVEKGYNSDEFAAFASQLAIGVLKKDDHCLNVLFNIVSALRVWVRIGADGLGDTLVKIAECTTNEIVDAAQQDELPKWWLSYMRSNASFPWMTHGGKIAKIPRPDGNHTLIDMYKKYGCGLLKMGKSHYELYPVRLISDMIIGLEKDRKLVHDTDAKTKTLLALNHDYPIDESNPLNDIFMVKGSNTKYVDGFGPVDHAEVVCKSKFYPYRGLGKLGKFSKDNADDWWHFISGRIENMLEIPENQKRSLIASYYPQAANKVKCDRDLAAMTALKIACKKAFQKMIP